MAKPIFRASTITAVLLSLASFMPAYESISVNAQGNMTGGGMITGPLLTGPLGLNSTNSTSVEEPLMLERLAIPTGPLLTGLLGMNSTNSTSVVGMTNNASR